jgi:hypothetical protein
LTPTTQEGAYVSVFPKTSTKLTGAGENEGPTKALAA